MIFAGEVGGDGAARRRREAACRDHKRFGQVFNSDSMSLSGRYDGGSQRRPTRPRLNADIKPAGLKIGGQ